MVSDSPVHRLREICLRFPEAVESSGVVDVTFKVRNKIFAMYLDNHHGDGKVAMWCKAPPGMQQALVSSEPKRYFVPPYVGHHGWVGVRLEQDVDWEELTGLVDDSYRMTASKRQLKILEEIGTL